MILRVEDERGETLHDCRASGCETSWDGYLIADGTPVQGRGDPDPAVWYLSQRGVARLKPRQ